MDVLYGRQRLVSVNIKFKFGNPVDNLDRVPISKCDRCCPVIVYTFNLDIVLGEGYFPSDFQRKIK